MASRTVNTWTGNITVSGGAGSVTITDFVGRPILIAVKGAATTDQFIVTINDDISTVAGVSIDEFKAMSRSSGQARAHYWGNGLAVLGELLTITISGATGDGTYTYIVRSI